MLVQAAELPKPASVSNSGRATFRILSIIFALEISTSRFSTVVCAW